MTRSEAGRLGGQATVRRHGIEHMRAIGKRGFQALATFAKGGRRMALEKLASRGLITPRYSHGPELTPEQETDVCQSVGYDSIPW